MTEDQNEPMEGELEEIPRGQVLFDRLLWLFVGSLLLSALLYNAWGLIDLARVPLLSP